MNDELQLGQVIFVGYPFMAVVHDEDADDWAVIYPVTVEGIQYGKDISWGWYRGLASQYRREEFDWYRPGWLGELALLGNWGQEEEDEDYE